MKQKLVLCIVAVLFTIGLFPLASASASEIVGNGNPASCTEAAFDAALQDGGDIVFNCGNGLVTINLTSTKIIAAKTKIDGNKRVTLSANGASRLFIVNADAELTLTQVTLTQGKALAGDEEGNGGAILNKGGSLSLIDAMISASSADGMGGAIYSEDGKVLIDRATIFNNASSDNGAALYFSKGDIQLANVTISGNISGAAGGGIYNDDGVVHITHVTMFNNKAIKLAQDIYTGEQGKLTLMNTIVSNPKAKDNEPIVTNCAGTVEDGGNNLQYPDSSCGVAIQVSNPMLAPLANYGGYPQTHALKSGSPAIDTANSNPCMDDPVDHVDARKLGRPSGGACDIGAYEYVMAIPTAVPVVPTNQPVPTNVPGRPRPQPTPTKIIIIIKIPTPCPSGTQGTPGNCLPIPR